ncbi:MAG: helix-turn-helix transcriptional regulator [Labilithrix sp.]|nr:helix-turn-helix transcriptional regulator [Labilithrix sp.]
MRSVLAAVEASYAAAATGSVEGWLEQTTEALVAVLGGGRGTFGYRYDARGEPAAWTITPPVVREGSAELGDAIASTFAAAPGALLAGLYRAKLRVMTASELGGRTLDELDVGDAARFSRRLGVVDLVSLQAGEPGGRGAIFGAATGRRRSLEHAERWRLARLAGHLAAAHRLVSAVEHLTPAATLAVDGRLLDAAPRARRDAAPLRAAVRAMDRARGELRRTDPERALVLWRALVDGRYSLVDRFESDGKRYVIAYENAPGAADPRGLSPRERAVASLLALALPDKLIAYELGLAEGTVRAHVHAVLRKLGVSRRAAAVPLLAPPSLARTIRLGATGPSVVVFSTELAGAGALGALSAAERAIAELAVRGVPTRVIATRRGTSARTVNKQLASAFSKLGVGSRAELAALTSTARRGRPET